MTNLQLDMTSLSRQLVPVINFCLPRVVLQVCHHIPAFIWGLDI